MKKMEQGTEVAIKTVPAAAPATAPTVDPCVRFWSWNVRADPHWTSRK